MQNNFYPPYVSIAGTKFIVFSLSGYTDLGESGTDQREILHDGTYWYRTDLLPFLGRCPRGSPNPKFGPKF